MDSSTVSSFDVRIKQVDGFAFQTEFDKEQFDPLRMDEPAPLGRDSAPNASRILAAAIGNCLAASLLFCMQRADVKAKGIGAGVHVEIVRNEARRLRIGKVIVTLHPEVSPEARKAFEACLPSFEDFCVVTASVRQGINVETRIEPIGQ